MNSVNYIEELILSPDLFVQVFQSSREAFPVGSKVIDTPGLVVGSCAVLLQLCL